jgi:hypothetical protein
LLICAPQEGRQKIFTFDFNLGSIHLEKKSNHEKFVKSILNKKDNTFPENWKIVLAVVAVGTE